MVDFFRVLPIQFGSMTRDLVTLVMGAGVGLGILGLLAVRADLPHPLTRCRWEDHRRRARPGDPLYPNRPSPDAARRTHDR